MFQRIHLDTYLQYLCLVCRYAEFAQYEADSEGVDHSLTLVHHLGQKWSLFLKDWIAQGMKTTTGISPHIDITNDADNKASLKCASFSIVLKSLSSLILSIKIGHRLPSWLSL